MMNDGTPIQPVRNVELGASGEEFQNLHEFVRKARSRLNQNAWDYIVGASETETTMRRNRMALDEIAFRPRVLRNVARVDASTEVFGRKLHRPARSRSSIPPQAPRSRAERASSAPPICSVRCPNPGLKRRQRQRPTRCASTSSMSAVTMLLSKTPS